MDRHAPGGGTEDDARRHERQRQTGQGESERGPGQATTEPGPHDTEQTGGEHGDEQPPARVRKGGEGRAVGRQHIGLAEGDLPQRWAVPVRDEPPAPEERGRRVAHEQQDRDRGQGQDEEVSDGAAARHGIPGEQQAERDPGAEHDGPRDDESQSGRRQGGQREAPRAGCRTGHADESGEHEREQHEDREGPEAPGGEGTGRGRAQGPDGGGEGAWPARGSDDVRAEIGTEEGQRQGEHHAERDRAAGRVVARAGQVLGDPAEHGEPGDTG